MGKIKRRIAKILGIKPVVHTIRDREFSPEELKYIGDFLATGAGEQLCSYLVAQKLAVADRSSNMFDRGDFWQGYANGYRAAVENFLNFRQPDGNGVISGDSGEVGLEELANKLD